MSCEACPLSLLDLFLTRSAICVMMTCPHITDDKRSKTARMEWRAAAGKKMHATVGVTNAKLG